MVSMTALITSSVTGGGPELGIEYASRDEITALQIQRAKATLRHVYYNVPHYRKATPTTSTTWVTWRTSP